MGATGGVAAGKAGVSRDPGARRLAFRPRNSYRGEDPEKEDSMYRALGRPNLWLLPALALVLLMIFAVLFDNGVLLAPLLGEAAGKTNYLHEFFHDGRHLLGVPGH